LSQQGIAGRPSELLVPLQAQRRAMGGVANAARQSAQRLFSNNFFEISTLGHRGTQAPLGWALSPAARADLDQQLTVAGGLIHKVRCTIDPTSAC
jgi:hypothetical protein